MIRSAGILMPVTSLPSPYGVGTLGQAAKDFIDYLADGGQTYWQMLPLGPTGYGNSPYQALSSYAGSTYLIDLDELISDGLLKKEEVKAVKWEKHPDVTDYGILYNERNKILKLAADRLPYVHPEDYFTFLENEKSWLRDYAVFMAIKADMKGEPWQKWPQELRRHDSWETARKAEELAEEVIFWQRVQYFFWKQMTAIKDYAVKRGIKIIGDLPFYIAADSIDVWSHPEAFEMDYNNNMLYVSGFGPDGAIPKGRSGAIRSSTGNTREIPATAGGSTVSPICAAFLMSSVSTISRVIFPTTLFRRKIPMLQEAIGAEDRDWKCSAEWKRNSAANSSSLRISGS